MSVAGPTRRGTTVTSYQVQLSDGQASTVIADAAQRRSAAERSTTWTPRTLPNTVQLESYSILIGTRPLTSCGLVRRFSQSGSHYEPASQRR